MYVLDALKELDKDPIQDEELLRLVVIELNRFLSIEDRLPLSYLPPLRIINSLMDTLSDTDRYALLAREIILSDPSELIKVIEEPPLPKHEKQDQLVKVIVGLFAGVICITAVIVDTDAKIDWNRLIEAIINALFK